MQLKTILNHVQKYKSFVYEEARLIDDGDQPRIEVTIRARKNGQPLCGQCRQPGPRYGRLEPRRYEFVPLWGMAVLFVYARRRVNCPDCGVKAEWVPWAEGKETLTKTSVVPGGLGSAAIVEGSGRSVRLELGSRVPLGAVRRAVGPGAPR